MILPEPKVLSASMMNHAGLREAKIWGHTTMIVRGTTFSLHRAVIRPKSKCSVHYHQAKHNLFMVEKGELQIISKRDGLREVCTLREGENCCIAAGIVHSFENNSDQEAVLIEFYWAEVDPCDITRFNTGSSEN